MKYKIKVQNKTWFQKGFTPWNKGKKGVMPTPWNKGKQRTWKAPSFSKGHTPWNKGLKGYLAGENSPHWKGGIRGESYLERRRFQFQMQKLIFERDNYQCQICGNKGDLQVDHIQSWSEFKELRFDPENCRTLCAKCHYKITYKREMPKTTKAWGHNLGRT